MTDYQQGFAAGIEAASHWLEMQESGCHDIYMHEVAAIRALRPPAPAESGSEEIYTYDQPDMREYRNEPPSASELAGAPSEEVRRLKDRIDTRLNNCLCEMKEGYDDSIVGFNEAWDIVRAVFKEEMENGQ